MTTKLPEQRNEMSVRCELGLDDYRRLSRYCWFRSIRNGKFGRLIVNLLLAGYAYAHIHYIPWLNFPIGWQFAVVPCIVLLWNLCVGLGSIISSDRVARVSAKLPPYQNLTIKPDGVRVITDTTDRLVRWSGILSIERDQELFYFFTGSTQAILIKRDIFRSVESEKEFLGIAKRLRSEYRRRGFTFAFEVTPSYEYDDTLAFQLTQADLKALFDFQRRLTGMQRRLVAQNGAFVVVGFCAIVASDLPYDLLNIDWGWLAFAAVFPAIVSAVNLYFSSSQRSAATLISFYPYAAPHSVEMIPEAFTITGGMKRTIAKWTAIADIVSEPGGIYIVFTKYDIVLVPSSAFRSAREQESIFNKLRAYWKNEELYEQPLSAQSATVWPPLARKTT